jgi:lactate permease
MGGWKAMRGGAAPCLVSGAVIGVVSHFTNQVDRLVVLTGVLSGAAVILAMVLFLKVTGARVIDRSKLTEAEIDVEVRMPLAKAASPWMILIAIVLLLNVPQASFNLLYRDLTMPVFGVSADGKAIVTRALWNAYTWIFVSILLSMLFIKPSRVEVSESLRLWRKRAPRPVFAAAIFFAIGEIMNMSGFSMAHGAFATDSMVTVLASFSSQALSSAYGSVVAFIGLLGGFITGSEASTIAMFSNYTMKTARALGMNQRQLLVVSAGLAFGGGLASVISPAKLQNAAAAIDKMGEETGVIKIAFVLALLLTFATGVIVMAELGMRL